MFNQHIKQQKYTSYNIKPLHVHVLLSVLSLYILNKNYQ
jgi:hypothetical protein